MTNLLLLSCFARLRHAAVAYALVGAGLGLPLPALASLPCVALAQGSAERMACEYAEWRHDGGARYGAIAYDPATRSFGWSYRWGTRALAEQRALQECRAAGGRECLVATWFQNHCGALASSPRGAWGSTSAPSSGAAAGGALAECARYAGGERCSVLARGCSG